MNIHSLVQLLTVSLVSATACLSAHAASSTWASTVGGNWSNAGLWLPSGVPATNGTADIHFTGTSRGVSVVDSTWATSGSVNSVSYSGSLNYANTSARSLEVAPNVTLSIGTLNLNQASGFAVMRAAVTGSAPINYGVINIGQLAGTKDVVFDTIGNINLTGNSSAYTGNIIVQKLTASVNALNLSGGQFSLGGTSSNLSAIGTVARVIINDASVAGGITYQKSRLDIGTTAPIAFSQNNVAAISFTGSGSQASTFRFTNGISASGGVYDVVQAGNARAIVELQNTSGTFSGFLQAAATQGTASFRFSNTSGTQTFEHVGTSNSGALNATNNTFGIERAAGGTTVLTGPNTYTGTTFITGGVLRANGAAGDAITGRSITATNGTNVVSMANTSGLAVGQLLIFGSTVGGNATAQVITAITPGVSVTLSGNSPVGATFVSTNSYGALGVGAVSVTGGVLSGNGTIRPGSSNAITINGGAINAGDIATVGTLIIDGGASSASGILRVNANAASSFVFDLNSGFSADKLSFLNLAAGDVVFGNTTNSAITFNDLTGGSLSVGSYEIMTGLTTATFSGLTLGATGSLGREITAGLGIDSAFQAAYAGSTLWIDETTGILALNVVPEPSVSWLIVAGSAALLLVSRRRAR